MKILNRALYTVQHSDINYIQIETPQTENDSNDGFFLSSAMLWFTITMITSNKLPSTSNHKLNKQVLHMCTHTHKQHTS